MKSADQTSATSPRHSSARRRFLETSLKFSLASAPMLSLCKQLWAQDNIHGHGQIKPAEPVPDVKIVRNNGYEGTLLQLLQGRATAVQLMYTSCTTTCPIEAAIFQRVQSKIPDMASRKVQLLSLSIEAKVDTPGVLSQWLKRFHAGDSWIAAASASGDAAVIQNFFGNGGDGGDHSNQVSIVDRKGRMVWRTFELPTAEEIVGVLRRI